MNTFAPTSELAKSIAARAEGRTGGIKQIAEGRSDEFRVNPFLIKVQDGFNVRDFESDTLKEHIDDLAKSIANVGVQRALKVRSKNGELYLKDGECRLRATIRAIEVYGAEIRTVPVKLADRSESEADATLGLLTENSGLAVTPLGKAEVLKRLKAFGWSDDDIANKAGMSKSRVISLLELNGLGEEVKEFIRAETISPTLALEIARRNDFNDDATVAEIKAGQVKAAAKGRSRVTAKTVTGAEGTPKARAAKLLSGAKVEIVVNEDAEDDTAIVTLSASEWDMICDLLKIKIAA